MKNINFDMTDTTDFDMNNAAAVQAACQMQEEWTDKDLAAVEKACRSLD